jgi:hypothetical protein
MIESMIVVVLSLMVVAVAFAPLEWLLQRTIPFWLGVTLYTSWFALWMVAIPMLVACGLGWLR